MADNVIRLPRPLADRPAADDLGFFVRVGRNDHKELLDLLAAGETGVFGFVIEAQNTKRHRDLMAEARKRNLDLILDPKALQMALPGGHSQKLAELPWGKTSIHGFSDFAGDKGLRIAESLTKFAADHGFTQLILPTHLIGSPNDPWLRRDIEMSHQIRKTARQSGGDLDLIYSLAVPLSLIRDEHARDALIHALESAEMDSLWLRIEHFGDDASGEKTAAFIGAARDFHRLELPLVADNAGGLPAMASLAVGAVGGIAHGVTFNQNFNAGRWRREPKPPADDAKTTGMATWRVYLPSLDMLMKRSDAEAFLSLSPRVRGRHACKDTRCCPGGSRDMLARPARHAIFQRAREVDRLSRIPQGVRAATYMDERVRKVSDEVAAATSVTGLSEKTRRTLTKKQGTMSRFRQVVGKLVEDAPSSSVAITPRRRSAK